MPLPAILAGVGGLLGGVAQYNALSNPQSLIQRRSNFSPQQFSGPGGIATFRDGTAHFSASDPLRVLDATLGGQSNALLQGGLFNDPNLQSALGRNNLSTALGSANRALDQQASAFFNPGGFAGLQTQAAGLGNLLSGSAAGLFGAGFANQQAAGNQQGLFNQSLATQRQAAAPEFNRQFNRLQDRLFSQGRLGSTGGSENLRALFEAQNQADLGFQNNAFGQALQQQQFLGNLGTNQINSASGLAGQGLNSLGFLSQLEGQGFNQQLQALQANQNAGLQRLQAAQGLFGLGADTFSSQFGLGLQGQERLLDTGRFGLENILGLNKSETDRIDAFGESAQALAAGGKNKSSFLGDFLGGIFG